MRIVKERQISQVTVCLLLQLQHYSVWVWVGYILYYIIFIIIYINILYYETRLYIRSDTLLYVYILLKKGLKDNEDIFS